MDRSRPLDLWQELPGALDGAGHELREVGDVDGKRDEVTGRLRLALVDAVGVGDRLEGVEADTDRQDDVEERQVGRQPEPTEGLHRAHDEEVVVLEHAEKAKVHD